MYHFSARRLAWIAAILVVVGGLAVAVVARCPRFSGRQPRHALQCDHGTQDTARIWPSDQEALGRSARRPPAAQADHLSAVPATRGHAAVLAGLREPRSVDADRAAPALV